MTAQTAGILAIVMLALLGVGALLITAGNLWLLVRAFMTSVGWGLAVLFLPIANLVFSVKHWPAAKGPFQLSLLGVLLMLVAVAGSWAGGVSLPRPAGMEDDGDTLSRLTVSTVLETVVKPVLAQTDREIVAEKLAIAGIDPNRPHTFREKAIDQMVEALGKPSATMKIGGKSVFIFYGCFEVESEDGGKTVSGVHYMGK